MRPLTSHHIKSYYKDMNIDSILDTIRLYKIVQEYSVQGKIGFAYYRSYDISLKILPLSIHDIELYLNQSYLSFETRLENLSMSPAWMEYYILNWCRSLIICHKTVHVPFYFGFKYYWNQPTTLSETLNLSHKNPYILFFSEKANFNLKHWCLQSDHSYMEWKSMLGQVFFGLLTLQYYIGVIHNDFHWSNILVQPIATQGHWSYSLNQQTYYIYNCGFIFIPWDFGMSCIYPTIIGHTDVDSPIICQDFLQLCGLPQWIQKETLERNIPSLLLDFFRDMKESPPKTRTQCIQCLNQYFNFFESISPLCESFLIE